MVWDIPHIKRRKSLVKAGMTSPLFAFKKKMILDKQEIKIILLPKIRKPILEIIDYFFKLRKFSIENNLTITM